jgi:hypothetical protein
MPLPNPDHPWCVKCRRSMARRGKNRWRCGACGASPAEWTRPYFVDTASVLGSQFGRLTVVDTQYDAKSRLHCVCVCSCGERVIAAYTSLKNGLSRSCGCLSREFPNHSTHRLSHTPEYRIWNAMRNRCTNPKATDWKRYGGRGIQVCERWERFENFSADMGSRPSPTHSIDRVNNDGNYEPGNCRWATASEQALNRRPRTRRAYA